MSDTRINPTRPQIEALCQIHESGDVVKASEWTTGSGRYTASRAIPPGAKRFERAFWDPKPLHVTVFFNTNPRVKAVVAVILEG